MKMILNIKLISLLIELKGNSKRRKEYKTRIDVSRDNFKPERDQYRAKVNNNINKSQQEVNSSESDRDSAQSSLSYCRRNPIHEVDAEGTITITIETALGKKIDWIVQQVG